MKKLIIVALAFTISNVQSSPARAQTTTPILHDSIYSLAAKPSDFPNEASVLLLDEGVYRVEADGRNSHTWRQVVQILRPEGAQRSREQALSYEPSHQTLKVNWMRVVRPNGEVVSAEPAQVQESDMPAAMQNPTYIASKIRRMSLSGLDTGTILDYSITVEEQKPSMAGDFLIGWRVTAGVPVMRSNLVVDVPSGYTPRIVERNLNFKRSERVTGSRKSYVWATSNVPKLRLERFVPDSVSPVATVTISPPFDWRAIGNWYVPIARNAYAITPLVEQKISTVVAGARSREDSIRAIHRWVAQDIRYVAIELGRGGYVPRSAETVMQTGFGDCKDKAMLFLAALRRIGVTGYPVLLNAFGVGRRSSPALEQFNHMIAAVRNGDAYEFADLTAGTEPLGQLPPLEQGTLAVLVKEADAEEIRLPTAPLPEGSSETIITGNLSEDGAFKGQIAEHLTGSAEAGAREMFVTQPDSTRRAFFERLIARQAFDEAEGDSLESFNGKDFSVPAMIRVRVTAKKAVAEAGGLELLTNPLRPLAFFARTAIELEKEPARVNPIDLIQIIGPVRTLYEVRIRLPSGWRAALPKSESLSGLPGSYEVTYEQLGDELRMTRTLSGTRNVAPARQMPEIIEWLKTIGKDDAKLIVLQKPSK